MRSQLTVITDIKYAGIFNLALLGLGLAGPGIARRRVFNPATRSIANSSRTGGWQSKRRGSHLCGTAHIGRGGM